MRLPWIRLLTFVAGGLFGHIAMAQQPVGETGGTAAVGKDASSSTPSGTAPSLFEEPKAETVTPTASTGPPFRTGEATPSTDQTGAASTFATRTPPASFSVPGFYGRGAQSFVVGEGRLARPRFRFNANISQGYDDNVFQTPTHGESTRPQKVEVLVNAGTLETTEVVEVPSGDPLVSSSLEEVTNPGTAPKFRTERVPGIQAAERKGSLVTKSSVGFDIQMASRDNLFTFDFNAGHSYYWNRPGQKIEYNGGLSTIYLRKLTRRTQFSFTAEAAYQTQPDFSQPNQPTSNQRGGYFTAHAKADLSYRLTPRFSTVTSVSYNSLMSVESGPSSGDYHETTFGTELRYLFSPRLTLLGELRYSSSVHNQDSAQDTSNHFLLVGGELTLTRRFTASIRLGETLQTYSQSGQKSLSPYVETTLAYRLARGTTLQWNGRYGFENSENANTRKVARSSVVMTHIFSPRLQATLALNLVHSQTGTTSDGDGTPAATTETIQNTLDTSIGFQYRLDRRWSFNLNYTYTMVVGPQDTDDYYRQQIFLGTEFQF